MNNEVITFYSKTPPNKVALENFDVKFSEENRSCSDDITVYLKIDDNKISDWGFEGITSIITTATSSVFGESIVGMSLEEVLQKDYNYIVELVGEEISPRRQKSSVFGLLATRNAIHKYLNDGLTDTFLYVLP
ncbi:MAG: iron-sulfur cluster assembly scaffold protein [Candidatus Gracilibacteria bacterium]|nr:iron-sulfur cluster assembly scaffold protein [Candidatus Gracilibacteria bacterium]